MIAQAELVGPWVAALINYGALGLWVGYLIWRDNRDSKKRDDQHAENIKSQKAIESAFRTTTNAIITTVGAMKYLHAAYAEVLVRIKEDNENPNS